MNNMILFLQMSQRDITIILNNYNYLKWHLLSRNDTCFTHGSIHESLINKSLLIRIQFEN